jgi:O-antigen/teichoic acid export membrane protein
VALTGELRRLGAQSAIYGLGGLLSRIIAIFLVPLYTAYLGKVGFGKLETIFAFMAVLTIVLRLGITSAFFRFYFDADDEEHKLRVVRTSFWFTMGMATIGLAVGLVFAEPISRFIHVNGDIALVQAGFVWLWTQMNYAQITSLFRVEQRPVAFAIATVANVLITIGATIVLVVGLDKGATGAVVGNLLGTLVVYVVLLGYRRYQLGLTFDRRLLRAMNRFGLPLVPAALMLWIINFIDRLFIARFDGQGEVGIYSLAVRISSVMVFLMAAFQLAWPAFAYSIRDDRQAKRTYSYVLTYLLFLMSWVALALAVLAPWLVDFLAPPAFVRSADAVPLLCFSVVAYSGYTVLAIGIGRARQTQYNWIVAGAAAAVNVVLNLALIPPYGMMGAAVATLVAYLVLFVAMWVNSRRVYPVAYQWRRVITLAAVAAGLTVLGVAVGSLPLAIALIVLYPLALLPLGFYQPAELARLRRLAPG